MTEFALFAEFTLMSAFALIYTYMQIEILQLKFSLSLVQDMHCKYVRIYILPPTANLLTFMEIDHRSPVRCQRRE